MGTASRGRDGREQQVVVAVVVRDEEVRSLVEVMVQVDDRFSLVPVAGAGCEVVQRVAAAKVDAVVLDIDPGEDGLVRLERLREVTDAVIVVVSEFPDPQTLLSVLARGADGYIDRGRAWAELLPAVLEARALTGAAG